MSTNKWRVAGAHGDHEWINWGTGETGTERRTRWSVVRPDDGMEVEFPTHAEALAYADHMARTITITLPRDPDAREVAQAGKWASWKGNGWGITSNDPERAALNILAYHYRKARP